MDLIAASAFRIMILKLFKCTKNYLNYFKLKLTLATSQDSDEDWLGVGEGSAAVLLQQRRRGSGEDAGKPEAGPVHSQQGAAKRRHSDHQLHHLRPAACPLLPL